VTTIRKTSSLLATALIVGMGTALIGQIPVARAAASDDSGDTGLALQEVLVTATRREESVQNIPISVTALGEADLAVANIKGIEGIAALTPGLQFAVPNGFSSAFTTIAIRGLNSNTGPSTVGIYLDDAPISSRLSGYTNQGSAYPYVFDLNRIEVARGPQGTLFGAGSEAGTVRFITNSPSLTEYSGMARAEVATTEGGRMSYETGAAVGGPIVANEVGFRVSVWNRSDGGYVDRVNPADGSIVSSKANTVGKTVIKGALAFQVTDDVLVTPAIYYQRVHQDDSSRFYAAFSDSDEGIYHNGVLLPEVWTDHWTLPSIKVEAHLPFAELTATASHLDRDVSELLDQASFVCPSLGPTGCGNPLGIGYPETPQQVANTPTGLNVKATTAEVRLASNQKDPWLSWVAGVFYDHRKQLDFQTSYDLAVTPPGPGLPPGLFQDQHETFTDDQIAAYAQGDLHITKQLALTLGDRIAEVRVRVEEQSLASLAVFYNAPADAVTHAKETANSPKVGLSFQLDRNNLFYASYSKGFRIGGGNAPVPPSCPQVVPPTYSSDSVQAFEVGAKDTFLEGRVQADTSVFHNKWENIQQYVGLPCGPFAYSTNAGSAISNGLDFALQALITEQIRLNLAVSYVNAYYNANAYDRSGNILVGDGDKVGILPQVNPPWTVNAGLNYELPLGDGDRLHFRGEYNFTSSSPGPFITQLVNSQNTYPLAVPDPSTNMYNLRAGWARRKFDATFFINNLFNSTPSLSKYQGVGSSNLITYQTFRPRTVGLTLNYAF
jgi:iron complex outermembrane receptor protein